MIIWITRGWERFKAVAVILWPLRFILLVLLAMTAIFSLSQGQDALYGAVVEGKSRWFVLAAIGAWAVQTWYWARLLLHLPLRGFPVRRHGGPPFDHAFTEPWAVAVPRVLGAAVFVIVAIFVLVASAHSRCPADQSWCSAGSFWVWRCLCGPLWAVLLLLAAAVFVLLTTLRRLLLIRWQRPRPRIPGASTATFQAATGFAAVWVVLLCVGSASALWEFPPQLRHIASAAIVLVLFGASLWMLYRLGLPWGTTTFVVVLISANMVLSLVTIFFSAHAGIYFGPAFALLLNAGLWVGVTSFFLVMPGERLRLPVATLFVAGMVVFSVIPALIRLDTGVLDNHRVRPLGPATMAVGEDDKRVTLRQAFGAWRSQAPCVDDPCTKRPMILVAAQGGASRSGYWVATILGALEDALAQSPQRDRPFHKSVFAISSVSGGSLGAAVYQRLLAQGIENGGRQPCRASDSYAVCGQRVVETDFLGAVFFSAFGPDLLQRLFPGNLLPDRAEALEQSWELAWMRAVGSTDFAAQFKPRESLTGDWLPVLLLNGTSVKTGRRVITSDIAIHPKCQSADELPVGPDLPSTLDFFCLTRQPIRLSTAVHNSARFPYVSPVGTMWATDPAGHSWKADEIDDGGYFEVQGATTLSDILATLQKPCGKENPCAEGEQWRDEIVPIVISIQNDPVEPEPDCAQAGPDDATCQGNRLAQRLGDEAGTMGWAMRVANDVLAPAIGLASSRSGRGAYGARALQVKIYNEAVSATDKEPAKQSWKALRFNLRGAQDVETGVAPAMSWYLSQRSLADMRSDLCEQPKPNRQREIDGSVTQLGEALGRKDLASAIRQGAGCAEIEKKTASPPRR
jgi:hypothetical protein